MSIEDGGTLWHSIVVRAHQMLMADNIEVTVPASQPYIREFTGLRLEDMVLGGRDEAVIPSVRRRRSLSISKSVHWLL